jgi:hypothetical protein
MKDVAWWVLLTAFLAICAGPARSTFTLIAAPQQGTQAIMFGAVHTYTHSTGRFSLSVPDNWTGAENSIAGEIETIFVDPTDTAVLMARVATAARELTQGEREPFLKQFLNDRLGKSDQFAIAALAPQNNGSVGLSFTYNENSPRGKYKMRGDAFVDQHSGAISVRLLVLPEDQYDAKKASAYAVINSFRLLSPAPR